MLVVAKCDELHEHAATQAVRIPDPRSRAVRFLFAGLDEVPVTTIPEGREGVFLEVRVQDRDASS